MVNRINEVAACNRHLAQRRRIFVRNDGHPFSEEQKGKLNSSLNFNKDSRDLGDLGEEKGLLINVVLKAPVAIWFRKRLQGMHPELLIIEVCTNTSDASYFDRDFFSFLDQYASVV